MENLTPKSSIYYKWDNKAHYAYFAFYTNQALRNARLVLNHIAYIIDHKEERLQDENALWSNAKVLGFLRNESQPINQQSAMQLLELNMPFVLQFSKEPLVVADRLAYFLFLLKEFRNQYAHYREGELNKRTSFNILKNKFPKFKFAKHLQEIKKGATKENESRQQIKLDELDNTNAYKRFKIDFEKLTSKTHFIEDDFIFFLSLFLTAKETYTLLNGIKGKKNSTQKEFTWVRKAFATLNLQLPRPKVKSSNPREAILLNIVNDLSKLPYHLKRYAKPETLEALTYIERKANTETEDIEVIHAITKHGELFSYRCLQYLEHFELAKDLDFQINLGKVYIKPPYDKPLLDDVYIRELEKEIHTFGKLKNFDDTYFDGFIERKTTEGGIVTTFKEPLKFYSPKYHFSNKRIGFNLTENPNIQPIELREFKDEDDKFLVKNHVAQFIISESAIPYLTYCLINFSDNKVYGHIKKFEKGFNSFLTDIINGKEVTKDDLLNYNLKMKWIPTKIRKNYFQENTTTFSEVATQKLKNWLSESERILEGFETKPENRDKNLKFSYKKGDLATFIARDIVKLIKPVDDEKLSSIEYNLLQSKLAYFGANAEDIKKLYKKWQLYDKHPFLKYVSLKNVKVKGRYCQIGIKEYFKRYVEARVNWFKIALSKPKTEDRFHFVDTFKTGKTKVEIKAYAKRLLSKQHSLYLPNDLFIDLLKDNIELDENEVANSAYLFRKNTASYKNQWFYENENFISLDDDKKLKYQRDKEIRQAITLDRLYWDMLKKSHTIKELNEVFAKNNLSIYTKDRGILSREVDISHKYTWKPEFKDKNNIEDEYIKISGKRKIKDFGFLRHLLKDKKLPFILFYHSKAQEIAVSYGTIEKELGIYDRSKIQALKQVLDIDKSISLYLKKNNMEVAKDSSKIFRENVEKLPDEILNNATKELIINIRNKLLHNQVPELVAEKVFYHKDNYFSDILFKLIEEECEAVGKCLEI